jgi:Uma2 family endonuclease
MNAAGILVSVDEYLNTSYSPDLEYVDGALVERNVGDWLHSLTQSNIIFALRRRYPDLKVVPELRSKVTATRFRLPDVSVLRQAPATKYLLDSAFIAIEILSEDDSMTKMMEKLAEYEESGVPNTWLIDPRPKQVSLYNQGDLILVREDVIWTKDRSIHITRNEIFQS